MSDQQIKFERFKELHVAGTPLVMPNPWDAGSARLLESVGFSALATTSAGYAFAAGKCDSAAGLSRQEVLDNAAAIVAATTLPVSADLEDGFGVTPEICAETIRQACGVGLVGGSIEDATGDPDDPLFSIDLAAERVLAAAEVSQGQPFLLTARAEGFLWGRRDLADVIRRLQAFSEAGADVLYAPGLPDMASIETLCREVDKPVNVVMGLQAPFFTVPELAKAGVARISVGGSFARAAFGAVQRAAQEVFTQGSFTYAQDAMPGADIQALMSGDPMKDRA